MQSGHVDRQLMHEVNGVKIYRETHLPQKMTRSHGELAMIVHVIVSHGGVELCFAAKDFEKLRQLEKMLVKALAVKAADEIAQWLKEVWENWTED